MINMEFIGLDELIKTAESISTNEGLERVNKDILKDCSELAYDTVKPKIHKSKDNSKSGRKGSRPPGHASDNIPKPKFRKKNGNLYVIIGWDKTDNSPYYYMKMEEWGTTKRPPHHSFGTVNKLLKTKYDTIAMYHYEALVKKLEK
ncbi:HK97 gp10 family phage protein [Clostridium perfringens]|nr:HK97 gp10 family phage protein [Clostridium perfringens]EJT6620689.1 HK97 gp10 family phage protein [Clostridium perfringens]